MQRPDGEIGALMAAGFTRLRLPGWNDHAFVLVDPDPSGGPWASLFDVLCGLGGGEPRLILYTTLAEQQGWEPHPTDPALSGRQGGSDV